MPLTDAEIRTALDSGAWKSYRDGRPVTSDQLKINQNSVNVSLQDEILRVWPTTDEDPIDLHDPSTMKVRSIEQIDREKGGYLLRPGALYLAAVRESFDCSAPLWIERREKYLMHDGICEDAFQAETFFYPVIDGRSTCGRVGLCVHVTAGRGDHGFSAPFTLELTVQIPLIVRPGDHVAQVYFENLTGTPSTRYNSVYSGQRGPQSAVLGKERFR